VSRDDSDDDDLSSFYHYSQRAAAAREARDVTAALKLLRTGLALVKDFQLYVQLGEVLEATGSPAEALTAYLKAIDVNQV